MTKVFPSLEVHWGGTGGARDLVVGYLEFDGQNWSFQYADGQEDAGRLGFEGFQGLPKQARGAEPTESPSLFPAFSGRIPSLKRADVVRACGDLTALPREEALYEFLRRSGARTGTDQIWFTEVTRKAGRESEGLGKAIRNEIRKMVAAIRDLLREDIRNQLEGTFRILRDGQILDADAVDPEKRHDRQAIEYAIHYEIAAGRKPKEAVEHFTREVGFTYLNRLAALKLMEERGLIQESVSRGRDSSGFRLFRRVCEEVCSSQPDGGYRRYLELLFDDASVELRVLFDRTLPHSRIFPRPDALNRAITLLNESCPADVWKSDETIGWIYQYFTPKEDREKLRDPRQGGSPSPRNSYELAVRNQFYTPRYVVEFLTDNTLGRMWCEMRKGQTTLVDSCKYLVRRPNETFLAPGEIAPIVPAASDLSQEELLRQTVAVPYRSMKDPRDIRILDPACGSGHFLLYAFDLLLNIYEEAWADLAVPAFTESGTLLREDYTEISTLRRNIPGLILRHNLHGVDIDLRATQIAALALWLRAQRAYQEMKLKPSERPRIRRSNVVCAEPMPGDRTLLDEFLLELQPAVLRQLVRVVFEKMDLAGEAGSLLKIEEEIADAVAEAKRQWAAGTKAEQMRLWPETRRPKPEQGILFDTTGITEESFWHGAEERVLAELRKYARHAENGHGVARYIFAEDAAQGFAFVDVYRRRFDIVLMNPPFGDLSKDSRSYIHARYPNSLNDIYCAFLERAYQLLRSQGSVGSITPRSCFYLSQMSAFRHTFLMAHGTPSLLCDLGENVLDDAMNEVACYVINKDSKPSHLLVFRLLADREKQLGLSSMLRQLETGNVPPGLYMRWVESFNSLPDAPFAYWAGSRSIRKITSLSAFEPSHGIVRQGIATTDDSRFVRLVYEVAPARIISPWLLGATSYSDIQEECVKLSQSDGRWAYHVKSGSSQPWYSPLTCVIDWHRNGMAMKAQRVSRGQHAAPSEEYYFLPGFSWTRRFIRLVPYLVPAGAIPSASRYEAFPRQDGAICSIGLVASNFASAFVRFYGEKFVWPNFLVENVRSIPFPDSLEDLSEAIEPAVALAVARTRDAFRNHEPYQEFTLPASIRQWTDPDALNFDLRSLIGEENERQVARVLQLSVTEYEDLCKDLHEALEYRENSANDLELDDSPDDAIVPIGETTERARHEELFSYLIGTSLGRWDIRFALDPSLAPDLKDPFAPLPRCPLGMLLGPDGLPARPGAIASEEWLRARLSANTLPPEGTVNVPTITEEQYPLANMPWDGILVDDEGHARDIVARVREALRVVLKDRADLVEEEACKTLGVKDLRSYFRNPRNCFEDHIRRYSKKPRKAPIYWLLQSSRKSYGVWLYYHRLTRDTLFHLLRNYVEPKIEHEEGRRHELRRLYESAKHAKSAADERRLAKEVDAHEVLVGELADFRAKIEAVAYGRLPGAEQGCAGWDPDLNDGVILNIAPLHAVVPWKEAAKAWEELAEARFEWSHVAQRFWPQRVEAKCREDRSIAIAHGREVV